jgi:Domain of unknown function (DUF4149)
MNVLRTFAVACVAAWLGIMAFFSFVAAPGVFRAVDRRVAGEAVAALLPGYYRWGLVLCTLAVVTLLAIAVASRAGRLRHATSVLITGLMVVVLAWALAVTLPAADAARHARQDQSFALAHRSAVRLNALVMICAVSVLALQALTPVDRRGG